MKNLVLLIPGNPSVPGIYDPFLNQVVMDLKLDGETIHQVLPHLGQCNQVVRNYKKITVSDVIDDHRRTIKDLITTHAPEKVILIGHSLGSSVTISLYEEFSSIVDKFFILCPFLGPSENNKGYLKLFKNPISRLGMKGISYACLKNDKVSHMFFEKWLGKTPFTSHIPREISKPYYIKNFFSLTSTYMEEFEKLDLVTKVKAMDSRKSFFIFAPNDYWVPEEAINSLPQDMPYKKCSGISHDFCLRESQYKEVSFELAQLYKLI